MPQPHELEHEYHGMRVRVRRRGRPHTRGPRPPDTMIYATDTTTYYTNLCYYDITITILYYTILYYTNTTTYYTYTCYYNIIICATMLRHTIL